TLHINGRAIRHRRPGLCHFSDRQGPEKLDSQNEEGPGQDMPAVVAHVHVRFGRAWRHIQLLRIHSGQRQAVQRTQRAGP
ncbi:hypothetical protein GGF38_004926, partial [Coemansia sp. RSA 25]